MEKAIKKYYPIFLLPTIIAFIIGFVVPFGMGLWLSFCEFTTISKTTFVGFSNYIKAIQDPIFVHAFWYTALFAAVSVITINILSFAVASALTKKMRGTNLFRTVFFMPNLIGGIVLGYIWQLIFNGILEPYKLTIMNSEFLGFWGLVIVVAWQQIGYIMIIYIAGLQSIPESLNEAAAMDGANSRQKLFKITLPMMMPSITICTFLTLTNSFKLYDQNLSLTNGEPGQLSELLALNISNTFYGRNGWEGVGQAKAVLFFILVVALGLIQLYLTRRKEVEQ